jgi:hypothetical protein
MQLLQELYPSPLSLGPLIAAIDVILVYKQGVCPQAEIRWPMDEEAVD